ncbi:MAG TPA: chloride channel protein [Solirubrobacteraceae bacterium]|nr:chloride channel protein [Solirubrobacteraceae bacterium]
MIGPTHATPQDATAQELTPEQADATIRSKRYVALLVVVAVIGVIVSLAAWCFLEGIHQIQQELYTHLPHAVGYQNAPPKWWPLPILAIGALIVALAIERLPGNGGHIPAEGLSAGGPSGPSVLPGVILAGLATIGFGLVLGPEAPLIAIGAGLAALTISLARRDTPPQALMVVAAAGSFSALSFIFSSPLIAAVILIEATGLGGPKLRVVLVPGLLAAGIGTLVSVGMGHFTGLSTSAYALGPLSLSTAARLTIGDFGWTIAFAAAVGVVTSFVMHGGLLTYRLVSRRQLLVLLPAIALVIGGLAIAFSQATGKSVNEVLFSGQDQLPGLVSQAGTWSLSALTWLIVFKGLAYGLSLGSYRGGPTFPALFLGAAAGIMASHLPGFPIQAGVAVGMGAAVVAVLRLPLSAVVLATLLTVHAGSNVEPLIIVGVVVSYIITLLLSRTPAPEATAQPRSAPGLAPGASH